MCKKLLKKLKLWELKTLHGKRKLGTTTFLLILQKREGKYGI